MDRKPSTLFSHSFSLPNKHLATKKILDSTENDKRRRGKGKRGWGGGMNGFCVVISSLSLSDSISLSRSVGDPQRRLSHFCRTLSLLLMPASWLRSTRSSRLQVREQLIELKHASTTLFHTQGNDLAPTWLQTCFDFDLKRQLLPATTLIFLVYNSINLLI